MVPAALNYAVGDAIYLFGFSRGAYTVRSLGGILNRCGLLDLTDVTPSDGWEWVKSIYALGYRKRKKRADWVDPNWRFHHPTKARVKFIGVWDTVGALGVPDYLADFKLTRRHEKWPWFSLVGVIANGVHKPKADGTPAPHQSFYLGDRKTVTVKRPGYLYCYANDA